MAGAGVGSARCSGPPLDPRAASAKPPDTQRHGNHGLVGLSDTHVVRQEGGSAFRSGRATRIRPSVARPSGEASDLSVRRRADSDTFASSAGRLHLGTSLGRVPKPSLPPQASNVVTVRRQWVKGEAAEDEVWKWDAARLEAGLRSQQWAPLSPQRDALISEYKERLAESETTVWRRALRDRGARREWLYSRRVKGGDWSPEQTQLDWAKVGVRTPRDASDSLRNTAGAPRVKHGRRPAAGQEFDPRPDQGEIADSLIANSRIGPLTTKRDVAAKRMVVIREDVYEARAVKFWESSTIFAGDESKTRHAAEVEALGTDAMQVDKPDAEWDAGLGSAQTLPGPRVYLSEQRGQDFTTVIHEALHLYSDNLFQDRFGGRWPNEGATEYFTMIVCVDHNLPRGVVAYTPASHAFAALVDWLGVDGQRLLAAAYFRGKTDDLQAAIVQRWAETCPMIRRGELKQWFHVNVTEGGGSEEAARVFASRPTESVDEKKARLARPMGRRLQRGHRRQHRLLAEPRNQAGVPRRLPPPEAETHLQPSRARASGPRLHRSGCTRHRQSPPRA